MAAWRIILLFAAASGLQLYPDDCPSHDPNAVARADLTDAVLMVNITFIAGYGDDGGMVFLTSTWAALGDSVFYNVSGGDYFPKRDLGWYIYTFCRSLEDSLRVLRYNVDSGMYDLIEPYISHGRALRETLFVVSIQCNPNVRSVSVRHLAAWERQIQWRTNTYVLDNTEQKAVWRVILDDDGPRDQIDYWNAVPREIKKYVEDGCMKDLYTLAYVRNNLNAAMKHLKSNNLMPLFAPPSPSPLPAPLARPALSDFPTPRENQEPVIPAATTDPLLDYVNLGENNETDLSTVNFRALLFEAYRGDECTLEPVVNVSNVVLMCRYHTYRRINFQSVEMFVNDTSGSYQRMTQVPLDVGGVDVYEGRSTKWGVVRVSVYRDCSDYVCVCRDAFLGVRMVSEINQSCARTTWSNVQVYINYVIAFNFVTILSLLVVVGVISYSMWQKWLKLYIRRKSSQKRSDRLKLLC